ncbi:unnamed protein product, partial [Allacma fusca]
REKEMWRFLQLEFSEDNSAEW